MCSMSKTAGRRNLSGTSGTEIGNRYWNRIKVVPHREHSHVMLQFKIRF